MDKKRKILLAAGIVGIVFAAVLLIVGIYISASFESVYNGVVNNHHLTADMEVYSQLDNILYMIITYNFFASVVSAVLSVYMIYLTKSNNIDVNNDVLLGCIAILTLLCCNPVSVVMYIAAACTKPAA